MINDTLIAMSARSIGATVITLNFSDFERQLSPSRIFLI